MKDLKILISSVLIFLSFFVWYYFWFKKNEIEISNIKDKIYYLWLDINKEKINISNNNKNIKIIVNWEELKEKEIDIVIK